MSKVPGIIEEIVADWTARGNGKYSGVTVLMKAHSRGSVAGSQVAKHLADKHDAQSNDPWDVELVLFDPVPGPETDPDDQYDPNTKLDLGQTGLQKFTLVYSVASGYNKGRMGGMGPQSKAWFTPQQVLGAQTIIISRQSHSAGLTAGFRYRNPQTKTDEVYMGSRLNALTPGVYVDLNKTGSNAKPLVKVASRAEATKELNAVVQLRKDWGEGIKNKSDTPDEDRIERIKKVLDSYFGIAAN